MKRALIAIVAVVVGLFAVLVLAIVLTVTSGKPLPESGPLGEGVVGIKDGHTSAYLLDAGDGQAVLVDAGSDDKGTAILAALAARQLKPEAVRAVLLTHGHPDHTAAVPLLTNAEVVALQDETGLIEGTEGSHSPLSILMGAPKPTGIRVTHPVHDGDTLTIGKLSIRVFAVPGHTKGSAVYLAHSMVFFGDSASADREGALRGAPWLFSDDSAQNVASLKALAARLAPEAATIHALVFAHSAALGGGLAPLAAFAATH